MATPRGCFLAPAAGAPDRGRLVDPRTSGARGWGLRCRCVRPWPKVAPSSVGPVCKWQVRAHAASGATGGERERTRAARRGARRRAVHRRAKPGLAGNSDARLCRAGTDVCAPRGRARQSGSGGEGGEGEAGALAMLGHEGPVGWCVSPPHLVIPSSALASELERDCRWMCRRTHPPHSRVRRYPLFPLVEK